MASYHPGASASGRNNRLHVTTYNATLRLFNVQPTSAQFELVDVLYWTSGGASFDEESKTSFASSSQDISHCVMRSMGAALGAGLAHRSWMDSLDSRSRFSMTTPTNQEQGDIAADLSSASLTATYLEQRYISHSSDSLADAAAARLPGGATNMDTQDIIQDDNAMFRFQPQDGRVSFNGGSMEERSTPEPAIPSAVQSNPSPFVVSSTSNMLTPRSDFPPARSTAN